jgi:predicted small lipoprotein YifL
MEMPWLEGCARGPYGYPPSAPASVEVAAQVKGDDTMLKTAIILIALASFLAGCTGAGPVTVSEADSCARNGGLWRSAQALCDRAMGGGGGGGGY